MRLGRRVPLFVLSLLVALPCARAQAAEPGAASPAHATPPTAAQVKAARELFTAAMKDEDAMRWGDALEKFHGVAEVKQTAGVRYHIALCEEKIGLTATAFTHYKEALDAAHVEHNKDVEGLLKEPFLTDLRARIPLLTLGLPKDVQDVEVKIDQHAVAAAQLGVEMPIDPGAHHLEARAPGREAYEKDLVFREHEVVVLDIPLRPIGAPAVAVVVPVVVPPPSSMATTESAPPGHRSLVLPIAATAGAVVFAGVGVGAFLAAGSAQSDGRTQCATLTNCDSLKGSVHTWDDVALGAWIGAGVLAATAVVLWTLPAKHGTAQAPRGTVHLTAGPALVRLEGTF